jgi:hypothetical protein
MTHKELTHSYYSLAQRCLDETASLENLYRQLKYAEQDVLPYPDREMLMEFIEGAETDCLKLYDEAGRVYEKLKGGK